MILKILKVLENMKIVNELSYDRIREDSFNSDLSCFPFAQNII